MMHQNLPTASHTTHREPPIGLMALGTAVSIACIYLSQPILSLLASVLNGSVREMGSITTVTQIGFAAGIVFLVPLGDVLPKKRLIFVKLVLLAVTLVLTGLAPSIRVLSICSLGIGLFATAAQDFVPLAAELSRAENRGRAIGTVMGGLLLGILGSRVLSGVLADWGGWRAPFFATSVLVFLVAVLVWRRVPSVEQRHVSSYPALLRSMAALISAHPLLSLSTIGQGFLGFTFSAFWTMLSFHLSAPPFNLGPSQIGAFALAGFAGAGIAPVAGRLSDRHGPLFSIRWGLGLVALSFASMLVFQGSLLALAAAAVVFDLGVQMAMVSHQTVIYSLEPSARSRLNAVYIGGLFAFFALGSFTAGLAYSFARWNGVVVLCLASCALAAVAHVALTRRWHR